MEWRSDSLDEEQPPPASFAQDAPHMQDAVRYEACDDAANVRGHPEKGQSNWEFGLRVVV